LFYARTLHHIDRIVFRRAGDVRLLGRRAPDREAHHNGGEAREAPHVPAGGIEIYPGWTEYRRRAAHRRIPVLELTVE
jgi:hypothetical protein